MMSQRLTPSMPMMIVDVRRLDPRLVGLKDESTGIFEPERTDEAEGNDESRKRNDESEPADGAVFVLGDEHRRKESRERQQQRDLKEIHRMPPPMPMAINNRTQPKTTQAA